MLAVYNSVYVMTSHGVLHERMQEHMCVAGEDEVGCVQQGEFRCDLCKTVYDMTSHGVLHERMHDQMHFALLGG